MRHTGIEYRAPGTEFSVRAFALPEASCIGCSPRRERAAHDDKAQRQCLRVEP